jgi:ubiquinone/menaquinone biosynthesis C-methylase UbiE
VSAQNPSTHPANLPGVAARIAYRAFSDIDAYLDDLYSVYQDLYASIPQFNYEEILEDANAFSYCKARRYYVLVIPYTSHKQILLERSFANDKLTWVTIGGSLRKDFAETFIDAADRHASKTIANVELGEIEPIAFLQNTFTFKSEQHVHFGIAFVGRIRNKDPLAALASAIHSRGHFVPYNDATVRLSLRHNQSVVEVVRKYLNGLSTAQFAEFEVAENQQWRHRYEFHDHVVKPIFRKLGRMLYPHSLDDLYAKITELATSDGGARLLDVACGENMTVLDLAGSRSVDLVVGNDVSWSQVRLLSRKLDKTIAKSPAFVLFTNHDARRLPFRDGAFDFALCKNVLHHMDTYQALRDLRSELLRVARKCLIVEIMDPKDEGCWGRLRHRYYMRFLHDAGRHFLSREQFAAVIGIPEKLESFEMKTIRGVYQFALLARPQEP